MNTKICYVISHLHESDDGDLEEMDVERHEEHHHEGHKEEKKSKVILKDADYYQYIAKHGHHFNKELADYAISKIDSVNDKNGAFHSNVERLFFSCFAYEKNMVQILINRLEYVTI